MATDRATQTEATVAIFISHEWGTCFWLVALRGEIISAGIQEPHQRKAHPPLVDTFDDAAAAARKFAWLRGEAPKNRWELIYVGPPLLG